MRSEILQLALFFIVIAAHNIIHLIGSNSFYMSIKYSSLFRAPVSHMTMR